jgi:hypothetical protein
MAHRFTWDKLVKNAYRLNPKSRGQNYPYTPKWEIQDFTSGLNRGQKVIVPFVGTKSCLVSLRAWGVTQASLHKVTLLFHEVDIKTEDPNSRDYFQIQYDDQMYWIHKFDRFRNPLTSRCSCADEFFTWAIWKYNAGCLYGPRPKPYIRKTTTYPERNPQHLIGCCKHVYNSWEILRNSGLTMN